MSLRRHSTFDKSKDNQFLLYVAHHQWFFHLNFRFKTDEIQRVSLNDL